MTENRLRWYGHIMRRDEDDIVKIALNLPEQKRGRGRPLLTWWSNIERDLKKAQLPKLTTQDRPTCRRSIPKNRSCSEAGIQLHWCACVKWKNVTDPTMIQRTAHAFVDFINSLTETQRSKCVPRTLKSIEWVMSQRPNSKMLSFVSAKDADGYVGKFGAQLQIAKENYQLKVIVGPGHGIYEASMTYLKNEDRFVINSRDISRTNAYGEEPSCISATNPHLNMYCYCKDYVPSD
ncbi:hypothetical protein B5X24_HaOG205107 [Helicoverpa armigera]|uniref:Uncharacterized protein n=1 Tax=Helicoverpa armigera TaxID=29058 RepID=A0A2W1BU20_HELAM|nr:hypothetical protein B5X24_HaOG205107 [Helicoverpa armigera]